MMHEHKNKTHFFQFDSFTEMTEEVGKKWGWDIQTTSGLTASSWIGRRFYSYKDVVSAINQPWQEGMKTYEDFKQQLADCSLPPPKNIRRRTAWSEDGGDELCLDRLRSLQPYWRTTKRDARPGPINVTIVVNISTFAFVTAKNSTWRCVACAYLLEMLEQSGYRVEVIAAEKVFRNYTDDNHFCAGVALKQCQDPLDIVSIINCVSPWSLRVIFFGARALANKKSAYGLGTPVVPDVDYFTSDKQAILLSNVFSKEAAEEWVRTQLSKIQSGKLVCE